MHMYIQQLQVSTFVLQEAKRFDGIDRTFIKIMTDTSKNTNVLEACSVDGRLETMQHLLEALEACQKSLSDYLDTKRCAFPRFYFISDVCLFISLLCTAFHLSALLAPHTQLSVGETGIPRARC
jgi:hypothetical protein